MTLIVTCEKAVTWQFEAQYGMKFSRSWTVQQARIVWRVGRIGIRIGHQNISTSIVVFSKIKSFSSDPMIGWFVPVRVWMICFCHFFFPDITIVAFHWRPKFSFGIQIHFIWWSITISNSTRMVTLSFSTLILVLRAVRTNHMISGYA